MYQSKDPSRAGIATVFLIITGLITGLLGLEGIVSYNRIEVEILTPISISKTSDGYTTATFTFENQRTSITSDKGYVFVSNEDDLVIRASTKINHFGMILHPVTKELTTKDRVNEL